MPVAPFVATGTACGRLRSPACAQRSLLPPSPILLPTRFVQEDGLPGTTPDSPHCRSPGKNGQDKHGSLTKRPAPKTKTRKALCPPRFCFIPDSRKGTLRTQGTPYVPKTGRGRHNTFLFLFSRSTGRCPLPTVQRRGPAAPPEKSFLEGGAGENLLSTKGFPRSNPPYYHIIAVQRHCCPCRSCRRAG